MEKKVKKIYIIEEDDSGKNVINVYDYYELAFYETADKERQEGKEYYVFSKDILDYSIAEMILFEGDIFDSRQIYFEKGYVTYPYGNTKDENQVYYRRTLKSYDTETFFRFYINEEYPSNDELDFYVVNNDVINTIRTIDINQEVYKDYENMRYDILTNGDIYVIQILAENDVEKDDDDAIIMMDIYGNVLSKGTTSLIGIVGATIYLKKQQNNFTLK